VRPWVWSRACIILKCTRVMRARCKITSLDRAQGVLRGESSAAAEHFSPSTSREIKRKRDELAKSSRERCFSKNWDSRGSERALMKIIWRPLRETISRLVSACASHIIRERETGGLQTHCRSRSAKQWAPEQTSFNYLSLGAQLQRLIYLRALIAESVIE
jgi:hypothetical protein